MLSTQTLSRSQNVRVQLAALWMAMLALGYSALSAIYFYEDFFKYAESSGRVMLEPSGIGFHIEGTLWTFMSFWRMPLAALAVAMLAVSALGLWRRRPRARVMALLALWGVLMPQVLWTTEFLADWHEGAGIGLAVGAMLVAVAVPSALLFGHRLIRKFEGQDTLTGWATLTYGRGRLLGSAVGLAWLGFAATEFMDHANRLPSDLAYFGALMAFVLSGVAVLGIARLRAWALWAGVGAALFMALVPLAAVWTPYEANIGWHINTVVGTVANSDLQRVGWCLVPLSLLWLFAGPFLNEFIRKLRE